MAIARQSLTAGTDKVAADPWTDSVTISAGSDRLLLVAIHQEHTSQSISGVTWNSVALSQLATIAGTSFASVEFWYLKEASLSSATANLVTDLSAAETGRQVAWVFTGVDQSTTFRTTQTGSADSGTSSSLTVPSVVSGDYLLDALTVDSSGHNITGGSHANQTIEYDDPASTSCDTAGSSQAGSDGGVMSHTWTTSGPYAHIAVGLIEAGGGSPPITDAPEKLRTVRSNLRFA